MATKKAIWISYDLGLKGDYTGLYSWLDSLNAIECGDSIAYFTKTFDGDITDTLKSEIAKNVKLNANDRIYIIYKEPGTGNAKGKFLMGGRKRAPWEGYAIAQGSGEDTAE